VSLPVAPQLVANPGFGVLADVAHEPDRYAIEPKVDSIRNRLGRSPLAWSKDGTKSPCESRIRRIVVGLAEGDTAPSAVGRGDPEFRPERWCCTT
jgi:hypothetical protein